MITGFWSLDEYPLIAKRPNNCSTPPAYVVNDDLPTLSPIRTGPSANILIRSMYGVIEATWVFVLNVKILAPKSIFAS